MSTPQIKDYPKEIYLREAAYKIQFVKNMKDLGSTNPNKRVIKLRAGMSRNETFRTLLHEIFHLIEFEWPIQLKHKTIYKLEEAVFHFLADNGFL
jgi:hypothetical protein